jgi:hypothetical protein
VVQGEVSMPMSLLAPVMPGFDGAPRRQKSFQIAPRALVNLRIGLE